MRQLKAILAGIPYESSKNIELNYRNLLFLIFTLIGGKPWAERAVSSGRIDIVLERRNFVYLFEFKLNKNAKKAVSQIVDRRYYEKFQGCGLPIRMIGVNFNSKKGRIDGWEEGTLASLPQ